VDSFSKYLINIQAKYRDSKTACFVLNFDRLVTSPIKANVALMIYFVGQFVADLMAVLVW